MKMKWVVVTVVSFILLASGIVVYYNYFRFKSPIKAVSEVINSDPEFLWRNDEREILSLCKKETGIFDEELYRGKYEPVVRESPLPNGAGASRDISNSQMIMVALFDDPTIITKEKGLFCPVLFVIDNNTGRTQAVFTSKDGRLTLLEVARPVPYIK